MIIAGVGRGYLLFISCYHVATGVVSMFFPRFAMRFYRGLYACNPVESRHVALILKPWGALSAFAGFVGIIAWQDPGRYSGVVLGIIFLLLYRFYYRAKFEHQLFAISGIPPHRNRMSLLCILAGTAILAAWYWTGLP